MEIGIICSLKEKKVYCIEGSYYHKEYLKNKKLDIIYIPSHLLSRLITKNPKVNEWRLEDITKLEI